MEKIVYNTAAFLNAKPAKTNSWIKFPLFIVTLPRKLLTYSFLKTAKPT